jgi:hypothetical protein
MQVIFDSYNPEEIIPASKFLKNKKLNKYFNRETAAAIVCASKLLKGLTVNPETPFYYATGLIEYEDYGLNYIAENSVDDNGKFSEKWFIEKGLSRISPLNQFKVLQNMPLSFISIEHHLTGDNAVIYSSAASLLLHALYALQEPILIGAGKVYKSGKTEAGFALINKADIEASPFLSFTGEATELFQTWAPKKVLLCNELS